MRTYNYVFFNTNDNNKLCANADGYYTICLNDLQHQPDIHVVSQPLDYAPKWIRFLFTLHHAGRINKIVSLPCKRLWFPYYFKADFPTTRPLCFVISNPDISQDYYRYLKETYPDCKIVVLHRDLVKVHQGKSPHFFMNSLFDLEMIFDKGEAEKYGFEFFEEFESRLPLTPTAAEPLYDVFFAGRAKDRMPQILKAYDRLSAKSLKCFFYILDANPEEQKALPGIVYSNTAMSYRQMLQYTVDAKCLLDINQKGAIGFTSRFLEAVMYNKKLICDNISCTSSKFYNPKYIQYIEDMSELDADFVSADVGDVDYQYNGEFSPINLINQIDTILTQKGSTHAKK